MNKYSKTQFDSPLKKKKTQFDSTNLQSILNYSWNGQPQVQKYRVDLDLGILGATHDIVAIPWKSAEEITCLVESGPDIAPYEA